MPCIVDLRDDIDKYLRKHELTKKWQKAKRLFEDDPSHPSLNTELLEPKHRIMKQHLTHKDILRLLKAEKAFLRDEFGVINIGLFGSYVKGNQRVDSDIDLLVELKEPRFDWIVGLQMYLEKQFDKKIELVRKSDNVNQRFTERIASEVIYA